MSDAVYRFGTALTFGDLIPPLCDLTTVAQPVGRFEEAAAGGKLWINTEPWQVWLDCRSLLQILPGFRSDGASVPRLFWPICGPYEARTLPGAFAHDGLYAAELWPRAECDAAFHRLLHRAGAPAWKALIMFGAIELWGWIPYRRHSPESVAEAGRFCRVIEFPVSAEGDKS